LFAGEQELHLTAFGTNLVLDVKADHPFSKKVIASPSMSNALFVVGTVRGQPESRVRITAMGRDNVHALIEVPSTTTDLFTIEIGSTSGVVEMTRMLSETQSRDRRDATPPTKGNSVCKGEHISKQESKVLEILPGRFPDTGDSLPPPPERVFSPTNNVCPVFLDVDVSIVNKMGAAAARTFALHAFALAADGYDRNTDLGLKITLHGIQVHTTQTFDGQSGGTDVQTALDNYEAYLNSQPKSFVGSSREGACLNHALVLKADKPECQGSNLCSCNDAPFTSFGMTNGRVPPPRHHLPRTGSDPVPRSRHLSVSLTSATSPISCKESSYIERTNLVLILSLFALLLFFCLGVASQGYGTFSLLDLNDGPPSTVVKISTTCGNKENPSWPDPSPYGIPNWQSQWPGSNGIGGGISAVGTWDLNNGASCDVANIPYATADSNYALTTTAEVAQTIFHEIGHNFGAMHDCMSSTTCGGDSSALATHNSDCAKSDLDHTGMSYGTYRLNYLRFSECSRLDIVRYLTQWDTQFQQPTSCFVSPAAGAAADQGTALSTFINTFNSGNAPSGTLSTISLGYGLGSTYTFYYSQQLNGFPAWENGELKQKINRNSANTGWIVVDTQFGRTHSNSPASQPSLCNLPLS
jgi:hypothetical protein